MKLKRVIAIGALVATVACSGQAFAQKKPDTLIYHVKMKSSYGDEGTRDMFIKGTYFRLDYHSAGMESTALKNKDGAFLIPSTRRQIGKYPPGSNRENPMSYIPGPQGDVKEFIKQQGAKKVAAEKVAKKPCDVYSYTDKSSQGSCKLYVNPKTGQPVQVTFAMKMKNKVFHRTITYVSYKRGVDVPDSKFELPKGIVVVPMPQRR